MPKQKLKALTAIRQFFGYAGHEQASYIERAVVNVNYENKIYPAFSVYLYSKQKQCQ